jgi:hypothetical protein
VVRLVWSNDPESYTGGSVATGRASHAGRVKGDSPDKKGYPGPPGWGLGVGLTTPPRKEPIVTNSHLREKPGVDNCRQLKKRKDTEMGFNVATWNIRTMFHSGKMQEISNEIIKCNVRFIKAQLKWLGHIVRMEQAQMVKILTEWNPTGRRSKGRPKRRWTEDVLQDLRTMKIKNWKQKAINREA